MDLSRHVAVLWRFRHVVLGGIAFGIIVAVLASYSVSWKDGPSFTPRGEEQWTAVSSFLVTQPGFPEGRVTLPEKQVGDAATTRGQPASRAGAKPSDQVEFADPARLAGLADLYSRFLLSDEVLSRVPGPVASEDVQASPFASSQGGLVLPVVQLTTKAAGEAAAQSLNESVFASLRTVLAERQDANQIPTGRRVELKLINAPKVSLTSGRSHTLAILAFLLCALGSVALAHLLAAVRAGSFAAGRDVSGGKARRPDDPVADLLSWRSGPDEFDVDAPERAARYPQAKMQPETTAPPLTPDRR